MSGILKPWRVTTSRVTYQDRWLKVRSDDCLTAEGERIAPFHVLEYPDWINVVALTRDGGQLLMVREYRHGRGEILTGLVSGALEADEQGEGAAERAARRELEEETGYVAAHWRPVLTAYANPANQTNLVTSFLAFDAEPVGRRSLDAGEAIEVVLADFASVLAEMRSGAFRPQAMHAAALWSAAAWIVAGEGPPAVASALRGRLRLAFG